MGRIATQPQAPAAEPALQEGAFEVLEKSTNELVVAQAQQDTRVRAVALRLGYQLPGENIDADLIQRDISANMRRSVEACFEVGKGLAVLKECCPHGQFMARLDVLGIEPRVAQRFMASAVKFSNAASTPLLKAIGNQTKLFEMLVLDDEQIEELELTGQTGELSLDDVAVMSVKELRAALREVRQDKTATEQLLAAKNKKIDELTRKSKKFDVHTDWPQQVTAAVELTDEVSRGMEKSLDMLMQLSSQALAALPTGDAEHQPYEQGMAALAARVRDAMARQREVIDAAESHFLATLGHFLAD